MRRLLVGSCAPFLLVTGQTPALAGAVTDGSLGPVVELSGDFDIGDELGTRQGDNLFHSFERFSIETGESATFLGPDEIQNVISRVTGGAASLIDGELSSEIGTADFYFINPAGVVFGPNATLDVPAAFHVSTADELRFPDGDVFSASDPVASSLSVAAPEAFGFLGGTPGAITVDGSALRVTEGQALSLIGGDVSIAGGSQGLLQAPAGTITLAAALGENAVDVETAELAGDARGDIALADQARVEVRGDGAGDIRIRAAELSIDGSSRVLNTNIGSSDATGTTDVRVDLLSMTDESEIAADLTGSGDGAAIFIRADKIEITEAGIFGFLSGDGSGGTIQVRAGDITFTDEANLTVDPSLDLATGITTRAVGNSKGVAGRVDVEANTVTLIDGARIQSQTASPGNAGVVRVKASHIVLINLNPFTRRSSGIASDVGPGGSGNAGRVVIRGEELHIIGLAAIGSATFSSGDSGTIDIRVDQLEMDGRDSGFQPIITTSIQEAATGKAGQIRISAGKIVLRNGAQITSSTRGSESAGLIEVTAGELVIDDDEVTTLSTVISSSALEGSLGTAGDIVLRISDTLSLDGGTITTSSAAAGGGEISLLIGNLLDLRDSRILTSVAGGTEPTAGNILIDSDVLVIDNSEIKADANAPEGFGGNVTLLADNIVVPGGDFEALLARGDISATGGDPTRAGTVVVNAPEINLAGDLVTLDTPLLDAAALLRERCAARRDVGASSFTGVGRGGLPADPDAPVSSSYGAAWSPPAPGTAASSAEAPGPMLVLAGCAGIR